MSFMMKVIAVKPGDRIALRKPHPCGGQTWSVTRTGADIGLECLNCGRRVMLAREEFERRFRAFLPEPKAGPARGARPESGAC